MSISADVLEAIQGMNDTFGSANPDTTGGSGGNRWPDPGPCNAWLRGFDVVLEPFRYDGNEVPGIAYKFSFETMDQPSGSNWSFEGAVFRFPQKLDEMKSTLPNNTRARVEIETNRLMGHFTTLLGARPASVAAGASALVKRIARSEAAESPIGVSLTIDQTTKMYGNQPRTFHKEFITSVLSIADD